MLLAQSCPTLCDSIDHSLPGSSVHGILQTRILEWMAIPFFQGSSWPRNWTSVSCVSCIANREKEKVNMNPVVLNWNPSYQYKLIILYQCWWLSRSRISLQCKRLGFDPWVGKISWRREWLPTPVFLSGEFHGQKSLAGYSPWGHKESDTTELLTFTFFHICIYTTHTPVKTWWKIHTEI